jgi:hypothetical protein
MVGDVIAGAIEDESGMRTGGDPTADLGEMQSHRFGIGGWEDEGRGSATLRTDGAEDVGRFVTLVAGCTRPRSPLGPNAGQGPLLADARFILEPDFDGLVFGVVGELRRDCCGEVFLNVS